MTRTTRLTREAVTGAALDLLDEVGLDAVSTRRLAQRLGVEQPSLYWHFRSKDELLRAMAEAAMVPHAQAPLPGPDDDRLAWFGENTRSLRRTLLLRRDGARLHAGSRPADRDLDRIAHKLAFLVSGGLPEPVAQLALLTAGRFTVGSVLEEQSDLDEQSDLEKQSTSEKQSAPEKQSDLEHDVREHAGDRTAATQALDHEASFEAGLALITAGLAAHRDRGPAHR